jgi:ABC-type sulfate transport system substrate-binding protein
VLKKPKLNFTFYNPNTYEQTVEKISKLLAETAVTTVTKVVKAQETEYNELKACSA